MIGCAWVLYFCISAGDIVAVLLSSYPILLSVADACSSKVFLSFFSLRCFDRDGDGIAIWAEPAWECQFHPTDDLFSLVGTTAH